MDLITRILAWHKHTGITRDFTLFGWIADIILQEDSELYVKNLELMKWARIWD